MNLILLTPDDLINPTQARLAGRRFRHIAEVLRPSEGGALTVGLQGGRIGEGRLVRMDRDSLVMDLRLDRDPPAPLPLTVVLALPRPKVLRRVLFSLTVLGVKRIILVNAARVEKSYWQSPFLHDDAVRRQLIMGLEQSRDTVMPDVLLRPLFKPFVQDELPIPAKDAVALVAHPGAAEPFPRSVVGPAVLVVGPEGGFIPYELEVLCSAGLKAVHLGDRIMNVETVLPALVSRLF